MSDAATVRLKTSADLPSAEILVLDSNFQFVHRGVGSIDVALAPGVYTVQYRAGSVATNVPVALRPDTGEMVLAAPTLQMKSPAPLAGNEAGTLYGELAQASSSEVHARLGKGGELFVFVRLATHDTRETASPVNRLCDVTVLDARGEKIAHLGESPKRAPDNCAAGYNLELDPGTYLLRFDSGEHGAFEQSFVVSEGWQTQVFASSRRYGSDRAILGPNLPEAAVFMMRRGRGFNPTDARVAWTESARQALAQHAPMAPEQHLRAAVAEARQIREHAPPDQVDDMLKSKFVNPMLGVYGAHLLLQSPERNWALLREVVTNLKVLVGPHPDVTALALLPELKDLAGGDTYALPPMLKSSWGLIIGESTNDPRLVPQGSYSERIADRTWGSGAWLVWRSPEAGRDAAATRARSLDTGAARAAAMSPAEFESAVTALQQYVTRRLEKDGVTALVKEVAVGSGLTETERAVLLYFAATADHSERLLSAIRANSGLVNRALAFLQAKLATTGLMQRAREVAESDLALRAQLTGERLVRSLGVPAAALKRSVVSLAEKVCRDSS